MILYPFSKQFSIVMVTIFSITMIGMPPTSPFLTSAAFASTEEDKNWRSAFDIDNIINTDENDDGEGVEYNSIIYPTSQSARTNAGNFNIDNKNIIIGDCDGGNIVINDNSQVIQTNIQSVLNYASNNIHGNTDENDDGEDNLIKQLEELATKDLLRLQRNS